MTHVLEIAGLVKTFGGLTATDHVNLTVNSGEIHALIGPNGAGKSTLINQICGELTPSAGHIHLAGRDITHLPTADRVALGLGRTFQITSLLDDMTVRQNLGLAIQAREGGNFHIFDMWGLQEEPTLLIGMDVLARSREMAIDYESGIVHFRKRPRGDYRHGNPASEGLDERVSR